MSYAAPDVARQVIVLAMALFQLASPFLFPVDWSAAPAAQGSPRNMAPSPLVPAGYAFAIWIPIYLGAVVYGVYQALPANGDNDVLRQIGWLTAIGFLACALWNGAVKFGPLWATVPLIFVLFLSIAAAFMIAARSGAEDLDMFVLAPLALYAGWLSVALLINPSEVLPGYGFNRFGLSVEVWSVAMLSATAALALYILSLTQFNMIYAGAVVWGLTAVVLANFGRSGLLSVQLTAGAAIAVILLLVAASAQRDLSG